MNIDLDNINLDEIDPYAVMNDTKDYFLSPSEHAGKKHRVMSFIAANPVWKLNKIVEKFNLNMRFIGKFPNGIGKFDMYTTDTECGIKINIMPFYLPVKKQWEDISDDHPQNWEVIGWENI
jgi:hypothetical protein